MRLAQSMTAQESIPLTIVGGERGATTAVMQHLLETSRDRRVAAILTDRSALNDRAGLGVSQGDRIAWPTGCFALATDDLAATLTMLLHDERPDHILVDADATDKPLRRAGYAYMPGLTPDGSVAVVDAALSNTGDLTSLSPEVAAHVRSADIVVLNRVEAAGRRAATATQHLLEILAPSARYLWCAESRIASPLILGPGAKVSMDVDVTAAWRPDFVPARARRSAVLADVCHSWCLESAEGLSSRVFRHWVSQLPPTVVRGAGSVYLKELPQHRHEFNMIGRRWSLVRGAPWGATPATTRIALVSVGGTDAVQ